MYITLGEATFQVSDGINALPKSHLCFSPEWPIYYSNNTNNTNSTYCCDYWILLNWHVLDITDSLDYQELFVPSHGTTVGTDYQELFVPFHGTTVGTGNPGPGQVIPCISHIRAEHVFEHLR